MSWQVIEGDALKRLREMDDESVQTCVTSPPYWGLRDYGSEGQLGLEATPEEYVANLVTVFRELRRVLRDDGTLWLNLGDSYAGSGKGPSNGYERPAQHISNVKAAPNRWLSIPQGIKPKDLVGIPWMIAFALRADGWYLRSDIVWSKPNPMPESVTDRPTKAHEYLFLLSKSQRYFYDAEAIAEEAVARELGEYDGGPQRLSDGSNGNEGRNFRKQDGHGRRHAGFNEPAPLTRNKRSVWTVATQPYADAHFATFPPKLIEPCILAGAAPGTTVLDPFCGSGTTGLVALRHDRSFVGIELNPTYCEMARNRIRDDAPLLNTGLEVAA